MTVRSEPRNRSAGNEHYLDVPFYRLLMRLPVVVRRLGLGRLLPLAVLTATGRSTGLPRRTTVYPHVVHGRTYLWCPYGDRAQWYRNVLVDPVVTLQSRRGTQTMRAVSLADEAEAEEVVSALQRFGGDFFRSYLDGQGLTGTAEDIAENKDRLHVLRLDPCTEPGPPALRADLAWVWSVALVALPVVVRAVRRSHG